MFEAPVCPHCLDQSEKTTWKAQAKEWDCGGCEKRFNAPPPETIPDPLASTEEIFEGRSRALARHGDWQTRIIERWPGPLAFTYRLLQKTLDKGQVDASALVLKDFVELLARFSALVMARDVLTHGTENNQRDVRLTLLGKPMSMGSWLELADQLARQLVSDGQNFAFPEIASLWRNSKNKTTALKDLIGELVTWRNDNIGHGVRGDDQEQTMSGLEKFLGAADKQKNLHAALMPYVGLFDGIELIDQGGQSFAGADAVHPEHQGVGLHALTAAVGLVLADTGRKRQLGLQPFVVARRCQQCEQVETFHFDSLRGRKTVPDVRLFNYEHGHAYNGLADAVILMEYGKLDTYVDADSSHVFEQEAMPADLAKMLEAQSVEKSYLSPEYLREPLRSFIEHGIETERGGVYWLRAPAHVGKTTFVRGLDPDLRGMTREKLLIADLAVAVFYIRREYQFQLAQFADQLRDKLRAVLNLDSGTHVLPALDITTTDHRKAFSSFLGKYQELSRRTLLVVIDGLDELAEQHPGIADFLPQPEALPDRVFVVMTSRREDELSPWLISTTSQLSLAECRDIDLADSGYVALMDEYGRRALEKRPQIMGQIDTLLPILREKSSGRFLYFRFLVDRLADGDLKSDDIVLLTNQSEMLVPQFIVALLARYSETPMADRIQRVLLNLAASEEAFEQHQQLLPVLAQSPWSGLPMEVLSQMVEGQEAMTPNLALTLYLLKPLLGTWRKEDTNPRYRLGIKGLSEVIRNQFSDQLDRLHAHQVHRVLDIFSEETETLIVPVDIEWSTRYLDGYKNAASELFRESGQMAVSQYNIGKFSINKAYGEGLDVLDWCNVSVWSLGLVRERFGDANNIEVREALALAMFNRAENFRRIGEIDVALSDYNASLNISWQLGTEHPSAEHFEMLVKVAASNSTLLQHAGKVDAALASAEFAITALEYIRKVDISLCSDEGNSWSIFKHRMNEKLAAIYLTKGNLLVMKFRLEDAGVEMSRAQDILEAIRMRDGDRFSVSNQYSLAGVYRASGDLLLHRGDWRSARQKYDQSISMLEHLRSNSDGQLSMVHVENELASAYVDRGLAFRRDDNVGMAIQDYTHSINILESHRGLQGELGTLSKRDTLAIAYLNRGSAKSLQENVGGAARDDFNKGIEIWEQFQAKLAKQFPSHMMASLSLAYSARGTSFSEENDHTQALADLSSALGLVDTLIKNSGSEATLEIILQRSSIYMSRGIAFGRRSDSERTVDDRQRSISDYSAAIEQINQLCQDLVDDAPLSIADKLAMAYVNRGVAREHLKEFDGAYEDYQNALKILLRQKRLYGDQFPKRLTEALAISQSNLLKLASQATSDHVGLDVYSESTPPSELADLGSIHNPVKCEGVSGERSYLQRLLDNEGRPIKYVRVGSLKSLEGKMLDQYEITSQDSHKVTAYFDMYHKNFVEQHAIPGLLIAADNSLFVSASKSAPSDLQSELVECNQAITIGEALRKELGDNFSHEMVDQLNLLYAWREKIQSRRRCAIFRWFRGIVNW